jgi:type IV pilus assembly protein PilW
MSHSIGRFTQGGFSLIELMIALTLGLILVAGVAALSHNSSQIYRSLSGTSQQTENGRYALEIIAEDLQHAGYFGTFDPNPSFVVDPESTSAQQVASRQQELLTALPAEPPSPCGEAPAMATADLVAGLSIGLLLPVTGWNNPMAVQPEFNDCIPENADLLSGTDVLAIRRADTGVTPLGTLQSGKGNGNAYIQATFNQFVIGVCSSPTACIGLRRLPSGIDSPAQGPAANLFGLTLRDGTMADIRRYHTHVYFIRPWSSQPGDGIPTLVRSVLTNSGNLPKMTAEPLVEGVENMQLQYGVDNDIDGSPEQYVNDPGSVVGWANVVSVRVNLLVRTLERDPTYSDSKKTYDLGGGNVITPPGDQLGFRRHVFSSVARLKNIGTRRECAQPVSQLPASCQ